MKKAKDVEDYIAHAPVNYRPALRALRALIRKAVPTARESISYGMPFYEHKGRLVYFAAMRGYIGLYIPPPIIADHATELRAYQTTKSAIHLPPDKLPAALVKKLIKARVAFNKKQSGEP